MTTPREVITLWELNPSPIVVTTNARNAARSNLSVLPLDSELLTRRGRGSFV
jgi:hypothetical protein